MRKYFLYLPLLLMLVLSACSASAAGTALHDPSIPRLTTETGWWVDTTTKLTPENERQLESLAQDIKNMGFQLGGVVWSNCASEGIDLATKFGNENKLGSAAKDNGIAIAVFVDKAGQNGEKPAISVAIGSGLEGSLNDAKVGRFLDQTFVPQRKAGNWQQGLVDFVTLLKNYLADPNADEFKDPPVDHTWIIWLLLGLIAFLFIDGVFFHFAIISALMEVTTSSITDSDSGLGGGGGFSGGGASR